MDQEIFERLKGETPKAWQAFVVYRDMGYKRSIAKAAREIGITPSLAERWSTKYGWVARVQAYDDYIERLKREKQGKGLLEMEERQAREAMLLQQKGLEMLKQLEPDTASWSDAVKLIIEGAKLERLARGEPTENIREDLHGEVIQSHEYEIVQRVIADSESMEMARELFRRAVNGLDVNRPQE